MVLIDQMFYCVFLLLRLIGKDFSPLTYRVYYLEFTIGELDVLDFILLIIGVHYQMFSISWASVTIKFSCQDNTGNLRSWEEAMGKYWKLLLKRILPRRWSNQY